MFKIIMSVFMMISSCFGAFITEIERLPENKYNSDINFESISAEETQISEEEKQMCRDWFDENILFEGESDELPYNFKVERKALNKNIDDWNISVSKESEAGAVYNGGKTSYITLKHKSSSLEATVEATIYEDKATCEWTVYISNEGEENSPVISDFYAMDTEFNLKKQTTSSTNSVEK